MAIGTITVYTGQVPLIGQTQVIFDTNILLREWDKTDWTELLLTDTGGWYLWASNTKLYEPIALMSLRIQQIWSNMSIPLIHFRITSIFLYS